MDKTIYNIKNLSFAYDKQKYVIQNATFNVSAGEFLSIAGPNGSGKTTLLRLMSSIINPTQGQISLNENNLKNYSPHKLAKLISYVEWEEYINVTLTVYQLTLLGRYIHLPWHGFESKEDKKIVLHSLELLGLLPYLDCSFTKLSSGEKQRVMLARALAQRPQILLLDEPVSHMDLAYKVQVYELLQNLSKTQKITIIITSHNINMDLQSVDRFILLKGGNILTSLNSDQFNNINIWTELFSTPLDLVINPKNGNSLIMPRHLDKRN